MDTLLLFLINKQWINPVLDRLMAICSSFDLWRPVLLVVALLLFWRGRFRWRSFLIVTLISIAFTDGIFTQVTKIVVNRPRPSQALADVREVTLEKTHPAFLGLFQPVSIALSPTPVGRITIGRSFPSGHAMNNTVIATLAILFFRWWGALYIIPAALISYSRIYCGSHWPTDIIVSVVLAVGFALISLAIQSMLYRKLAPRWFPRLYANHPRLGSS
ncbi:MAG TPA: phosphatase PAP2 family protein [Chthoniobacterales bacterium]|nr:phosphatase PAP2 family protein [Chthoniobacterales bacterium]